jgi:hypothetical protein
MFFTWMSRSRNGQTKLTRGRRKPRSFRPRLESLEARCLLSLTASGVAISGTEGSQLTNVIVAKFTDSDANVPASNFSANINWGDGTTSPGTIVPPPMGASTYNVLGTHIYMEESGKNGAIPFPVAVAVHDSKDNLDSTGNSTASIADAPLFPGNPVTPGNPTPFSGVGTAAATTAFSGFKTAIGGADNAAGAAASTGFRTINWDAVKLDGTDFGGNSMVISPGSTVGIPRNRFQSRGALFDEIYSVSGDGFTTVNPNAAGLFPAFSPKNTFAPFNQNTIDLSFVVATGAAANGPLVPAASAGFGAIFLNVENANTTSIEYFHGGVSLGTFFVPVGAKGQTEFLGELFSSPIVTNVTLTLGTGTIFMFPGTTPSPGGADNPPATNLVATDDFAYAEPVPVANVGAALAGPQGTSSAASTIAASAGTPFTGVVATFTDTNPTAPGKELTALINWGDGHVSNGTIAANSQGGFNVSGTNTYAQPGTFPVNVEIQDLGGSTLTVANTALVNQVILATGTDAGGPPEVRVFTPQGKLLRDFMAYDPSFLGGVRVAVGDVNGDGVADIITIPGPTGGPDARVWDGRTGLMIAEFNAFPAGFTGGSFVAAGDVNGDGFADLIFGADAGGGPNVAVYDGRSVAAGSPKLLATFFALGANFTGGVRVAAGDVNGDGKADIIFGAGPGGGPNVVVYDGKSLPLPAGQVPPQIGNFFAFAPGFTGGVYLASGDVDGDGKADVVIGAAPGGGPNVTVYTATAILNAFASGQTTLTPFKSFFAYPQGFTGGVRVAAADVNGDGKAEIITSPGSGGGPNVTVYDVSTLTLLDTFFAYNQNFTGGLFVAAGSGTALKRAIS